MVITLVVEEEVLVDLVVINLVVLAQVIVKVDLVVQEEIFHHTLVLV